MTFWFVYFFLQQRDYSQLHTLCKLIVYVQKTPIHLTGTMNLHWHENLILRNDSYCKERKKVESDQKPLKYVKWLKSWQTQHLNYSKKCCAGLSAWNELMSRTVNSLLKTDKTTLSYTKINYLSQSKCAGYWALLIYTGFSLLFNSVYVDWWYLGICFTNVLHWIGFLSQMWCILLYFD